MFDFLKTIFGEEISICPYEYPKKTPYYIRDHYMAQRLNWMKNECVLLSPRTDDWRLPTLKKQLKNFQKLCDLPCALCLNNLSAIQRRNLLEERIPFIAMSKQVYLPFWGCTFVEKFKADLRLEEKMAPATQLTFLYFYYSECAEAINLTALSKQLHISKATCTRAVEDLTAAGLLKQHTEGTNKWLTRAFEKMEFLNNGYSRLRSPVERLVYVKEMPIGTFLLSGIQALSDITMVGADFRDGGMAIFKKNRSIIAENDVITKQEFDDFGGSIVEIWSYDPKIFASNDRVDDISLLLSLDFDPDERVQMGLDELRKKHGLPVNDKE